MQLCVGSTVAVHTDEAPYPHLAVVQNLQSLPESCGEGDGALQVHVLWLYRAVDCKRLPPKLLRCTCRVQRSHSVDISDKGELKEIFFSSHSDVISSAAILHQVTVHFLPNVENGEDLLFQTCEAPNGMSVKMLKPGFICRQFVDTVKWRFCNLNSKNIQSSEIGDLVTELLARSATKSISNDKIPEGI
ncbi:hypothetical protein CEUSTIGMA_g6837.t1 [Chlamydomonas eustigma]|uniref:BAH domain-containing protein n=1 Tax=Chlamydomonas eustigma TaxID=1157962 RepID=A0A250X8K8_9CHLO|nr:hypothetical protein CEUSTIGMA_g6837.t1 [Chlamydomonas eustigma]|eukprot:GAX79396.1 hypothetical protein CEUSTIGMA_g6837.t1 [Chlamydomonas eustigma]